MLAICTSMALWELPKHSEICTVGYKKHCAKDLEWLWNDECEEEYRLHRYNLAYDKLHIVLRAIRELKQFGYANKYPHNIRLSAQEII